MVDAFVLPWMLECLRDSSLNLRIAWLTHIAKARLSRCPVANGGLVLRWYRFTESHLIAGAFGLPLNEWKHVTAPQCHFVLDHTLRVFAATCKMAV